MALVAITVILTLVVTGGDDDEAPTPPAPTRFGIPSPQPVVSPTTGMSSEPLILPRPARTAANGVPVGFPHTTDGAASAIVRWNSLIVPVNESREVDVLRTIGSQHLIASAIPEIQEEFRGQTMSPDLWATIITLGVKIVSASDDQVVVALLDSMEVGDARGPVKTVFRTASHLLVWFEDDWRLDTIEDAPIELRTPTSNDPAQIRAAGWEEFRLG
ncbi:hypothetical protein [Parafrankia sp. CH37]|uniref:hypothetical protein n=1 Tax=Parafrankia sp. CH37 TaxID=683308 RepID=UPI000B8832DE|nr:hypothetical protein [Parafrankia sp. CH37]